MYTVFARKYRPQTFDEIVGQEHCTSTLKNSIKYGRIAHAYLFAGPRGIGKTTTARIFAKALNCENRSSSPEPCNKCRSCIEIASSNSMDVIEIDGASNRGIEEVRKLRENVRYAPPGGRYKIYIIDEVHMLTQEAFNALLKTLEEPPKKVVFIFATTAPSKVPPTILSRCQRFNFRRIGLKDIINRLNSIVRHEKIEIEEKALELVARKADGALRDAESMLDQLISYSGNKIVEGDVRAVLGLPERDIFFRLESAIIAGDARNAFLLLNKSIENGIDPEELLKGFVEHLRTTLLLKLGIPIPLSEEEKRRWLDEGKPLTPDTILRMIRLLFDARRSMRVSQNADIYLEEIIVRLASFRIVSVEDIIQRLGDLERGIRGEEKRVMREEPSYISEQKEPVLEDINVVWKRLANDIGKNDKFLANILLQGKPMNSGDKEVCIEFRNEFYRESAIQKKNIIEEGLKKIMNRDIKFSTNVGKIESKKENPIVLKVREMFDAEIVDNR